MKKLFFLLLALPLLGGCYKDDLDPASLTNSPFDPDYTGPNVFRFDTTFVELVNAPIPYNRQVFRFKVDESLFLSPTHGYQVFMKDLSTNTSQFLGEAPSGSATFTYYKIDYSTGELCLDVALSNGLSTARHETICGILQ